MSGNIDGVVRAGPVTGEEPYLLYGHTGKVNDVAVSRDGKRVLSAADDKALILWDVDTGALIRRYTGHHGAVTAVAFLPDGDEFVSGSADGTLIHWRSDPGNMVAWVTENRVASE